MLCSHSRVKDVCGRFLSDTNLTTWRFHTCWPPGPSWACSPSPSGSPCWCTWTGNGRREPHPSLQSSGCCCRPEHKVRRSAGGTQAGVCCSGGLPGREPSRRGRRLQCRGRRRAEGRRCWCPAPAGSGARQSCSVEKKWDRFPKWSGLILRETTPSRLWNSDVRREGRSRVFREAPVGVFFFKDEGFIVKEKLLFADWVWWVFWDAHRVPQRHLPLTHAAEAGGEDLPVGHEDRPDWSEAFMRLLLLLKLEQKLLF